MLNFLRRIFAPSDRDGTRDPAAETEYDPDMKFLLVGLGNPGPKYEDTRHNVGFRILERLAEDWTAEGNAEVAKIKHRGKQVILIKPTTFMNLSGKAVRYWLQKESIPKKNMLVVVDDLHLDFGRLRLRGNGSDAGHNGLKDIDKLTGGNNYARLRVGIGKDFHPGQQADYVLSEWNAEERAALPEVLDRAAEACLSFCGHGLTNTMNKYNTK